MTQRTKRVNHSGKRKTSRHRRVSKKCKPTRRRQKSKKIYGGHPAADPAADLIKKRKDAELVAAAEAREREEENYEATREQLSRINVDIAQLRAQLRDNFVTTRDNSWD